MRDGHEGWLEDLIACQALGGKKGRSAKRRNPGRQALGTAEPPGVYGPG